MARVFAGVLLGGQGAAAYGPTAAALYGLADQEPVVHIFTQSHNPSTTAWLRLYRRPPGSRRIVALDPPRCGLEDAVIDTAAMGTIDQALAVIGRALQERRTSAERLLQTIESRIRLRHRTFLVQVIRDSADGSHSALEHRYLIRVERQHRLTPAIRQYAVPETGVIADLAYPELRVLIELDGLGFHDPDRDRDRDNRHAVHGYITLRFTWSDIITRPCWVATQVALAIGLSAPTRCGSCERSAA